MHKIKIEIQFRAGHRLLAPFVGKCNNPHGEGYTAILEFESKELDKCGMVFDFSFIKKQVKEWIDGNWDHAYIYQEGDEIGEFIKEKGFKVYRFPKGMNPTAENMAKILFTITKSIISNKVIKVGIVESFNDSIAYYEI